MSHEVCEFCGSSEGPILEQDMGEGRTMQLCPRCRQYIADGEAWAQDEADMQRIKDEWQAFDRDPPGS